jgi:hypothetical protein
MLEKLRARGSEDDVVDIERQVCSVGATVVDEQRGVRLGLDMLRLIFTLPNEVGLTNPSIA